MCRPTRWLAMGAGGRRGRLGTRPSQLARLPGPADGAPGREPWSGVCPARRASGAQKLGPGRWRAGYTGPDGTVRRADQTFPTKSAAERWLSLIESDLLRGEWSDPVRDIGTLAEQSERWLADRHSLAERTSEQYRWLLAKHVLPVLGDVPLDQLTTEAVSAWHASLAAQHPATAAKAYRLLSSIMRQAVESGLITQNPCAVRGASTEHAQPRPVATVNEVAALVDAMPEDLRALALLAAWAQLRRGELRGLRRCDIDLEGRTVRVEVTRTTKMDGKDVNKAPKTAAGRRVVAVPEPAFRSLVEHLDQHVGADPDAWVFTCTNRQLSIAWDVARRSIGRPDLHLHDLRHTGLTWSSDRSHGSGTHAQGRARESCGCTAVPTRDSRTGPSCGRRTGSPGDRRVTIPRIFLARFAPWHRWLHDTHFHLVVR